MQTILVTKPEATIVDLLKLPADHAQVKAELRQIHETLHGQRIAKLVWIMSPALLAYYIHGDDDAFSELFEEIGVISLGRPTFMAFVEPPNVGIRLMLQHHGITPVVAEPAEQ